MHIKLWIDIQTRVGPNLKYRYRRNIDNICDIGIVNISSTVEFSRTLEQNLWKFYFQKSLGLKCGDITLSSRSLNLQCFNYCTTLVHDFRSLIFMPGFFFLHLNENVATVDEVWAETIINSSRCRRKTIWAQIDQNFFLPASAASSLTFELLHFFVWAFPASLDFFFFFSWYIVSLQLINFTKVNDDWKQERLFYCTL